MAIPDGALSTFSDRVSSLVSIDRNSHPNEDSASQTIKTLLLIESALRWLAVFVSGKVYGRDVRYSHVYGDPDRLSVIVIMSTRFCKNVPLVDQ